MKGSKNTRQPSYRRAKKSPRKLKSADIAPDAGSAIPAEGEEFVQHVRAAYDIYKQGFFRKVAEVVNNA